LSAAEGSSDSKSVKEVLMKSTALIGIILIVLGIAALAYQGITYTKRETLVNIGPIHAEAERQHTIPLSPIIGVTAVVGGVILLVLGARNRT
jgi:uncharacterized membrane protein YidH (DUF202 family)